MKAEMPQPLGKGWKFGENRERGWMTTSSKWKKNWMVFIKKKKKVPPSEILLAFLFLVSRDRFLLKVIVWAFKIWQHGDRKGAHVAVTWRSSAVVLAIDRSILCGSYHSLVSFTQFFKAAFNLSLCLPIRAFDVEMPFLHLLNIWSILLHTAKSSWSGFT